MSSFRGIWVALLGEAVTAARTVLRDLDPPEIPAALRKVAAYSGGKLPPPLAASLLVELDRNEWLRDRTAESWEGDATSASGLFLLRPDGWWLNLAAMAQQGSAAEESLRSDELNRAIDKTEAKLRAANAKTAEYKKRLADERKRAKKAAAALRSSLEAGQAATVQDLETARTNVADLAQRLAQLEGEHRELQESFDALRTRLAKARRQRLDAQGGSRTSGSVPSDPIKMARMLDLQAASFGRRRSRQPSPRSTEKPALTLEPGIRPDSSDAIRWLLSVESPVVVLVDGYNAQFHLDRDDFTSGAARRNLIDALQRMRATAAIPHRVVVVYDSTLPGERIARSAQSGVEIRFAEQDSIADEEIVAMSSQLGEVVVVSSDREVREGAEANGAVVLWSEALRDWLNRV